MVVSLTKPAFLSTLKFLMREEGDASCSCFGECKMNDQDDEEYQMHLDGRQ
jgi:hypothetical protein